jgi:hypothetical protein
MRGEDTITAGLGSDTLEGGAGDDQLDGGEGRDIAVFAGNRLDYLFAAKTETGLSVQDTVANRDGTDGLQAIERLQFGDLTLAFDTEGGPGEAYALWYAAFDRTPSLEQAGQWIAPFDQGFDMVTVAQQFIDFYAPGISHHDEVYILYSNVVGNAPGDFEMSYYSGILDRGEMTSAELFVYAADHPLNQADFIDVIGEGVSYSPWTA